MKPSIVVVGSSNTDMVIKARHIPAPGETILGGTFFMNQGGKGANQAVAAARLGGQVTFISKIGTDIFGQQSVDLYKKEDIDTTHISVDNKSQSGIALIIVDDMGENSIAVAPGANSTLHIDDVTKAKKVLEHASIVLMQLEIPLGTVEYVAGLAEITDTMLILNPAPACALPDSLLNKISIITPNEKEAEMLTGIVITNVDAAKEAATIISGKGVKTVIITLGAKGSLIYHNKSFSLVPAMQVKAIDTTAAGDVFNGALAVALSEGKELRDAVVFANTAAAISVTKLGAQASAPFRKEVEDQINYSIIKT
ncbi:MAG: ribokinase [Ginsengibacter sp.]